MLMSEYKAEKHLIFSETFLTRFQVNPKNFHHSLVTEDETWVDHFKPESKIQSKHENILALLSWRGSSRTVYRQDDGILFFAILKA